MLPCKGEQHLERQGLGLFPEVWHRLRCSASFLCRWEISPDEEQGTHKRRQAVREQFLPLLGGEEAVGTTVQWFGFQQGVVNKVHEENVNRSSPAQHREAAVRASDCAWERPGGI